MAERGARSALAHHAVELLQRFLLDLAHALAREADDLADLLERHRLARLRAETVTQAHARPLLERHPAFPERVNAGYLQVLSREHAKLRVWERGAGETLACGTGACAAVVAGIRRGLLADEVRVTTRGGDLRIRWPGIPHAVMMTGDAVRVFDGEIEIGGD